MHSYFCGLEDIARSLYAAKELDQRYGKSAAWAKQTDVPGHTRVFPQILARSGIKYFMTTKLSWNQFNRFPYDTFRWRGLDGSEIPALRIAVGLGRGLALHFARAGSTVHAAARRAESSHGPGHEA